MLKSIAGIAEQEVWQQLVPDQNSDWLNQRSASFSDLLPMGDSKNKNKPGSAEIFENFSLGVVTNRDPWCNNPSHTALLENIRGMVDFYEAQRAEFNCQYPKIPSKERKKILENFIDADPTKISWTRALKGDVVRDKALVFHPQSAVPTLYRPFTKSWLYYDRRLNEMVYQMPQIFPLPVSETGATNTIGQSQLLAAPNNLPQTAVNNRIIAVSTIGAKTFSTLISDCVMDLHVLESGTQCFPEYLYDEKTGQRKNAITDTALTAFQRHYGKDGQSITKTQVFEYIYAVLHSAQYRATWANNLIKELPRIPFVANFADFYAFAVAGKQLADLHIGYETAPMVAGVTIDIHKKTCTTLDDLQPQDFYVEKMQYGKSGKEKDMTTIRYNRHITVRNIPLAAYEYIVNGRPAIDWIVDRQRIRTDKPSGIVSDANRYAIETLNNPRYPLELLLRVTTVSLQTQAIVHSLPELTV